MVLISHPSPPRPIIGSRFEDRASRIRSSGATVFGIWNLEPSGPIEDNYDWCNQSVWHRSRSRPSATIVTIATHTGIQSRLRTPTIPHQLSMHADAPDHTSRASLSRRRSSAPRPTGTTAKRSCARRTRTHLRSSTARCMMPLCMALPSRLARKTVCECRSM